jgi:geranylgeranyl transferase type-1 subunit beta
MANHYLHTGIPSIPSLIHFLVNRQFAYLDSNDEDDDDSANHPLSDLSNALPEVAGFNGRLNKLADTCYAWWNSGALSLLGEDNLINHASARRFILEKTQHLIGGFSKHPGGPPDIYHAYMGLAALGTMAGVDGEPGLAKFDPRLCVGADAAARMAQAKESILNPRRHTDNMDDTDEDEDEDD